MDRLANFQVLSLSQYDSRTWDYRKRAAHVKKKSGCVSCKAKRVKCDEVRPVCTRCQRNGRPCSYTKTNSLGLTPNHPITLEGFRTFSVLSALTIDPFNSPNAKNGTPSLQLMRHCNDHWAELLHMNDSDEVIKLFQTDSLVRNIILAIAACHLRHIAPGILSHRVAEHFQQSLVLQDYQKSIETLSTQLNQSGLNALLLSAYLLNILIFTLPQSESGTGDELDPAMSWVFSPHENRMNWLILQAGLKPLLMSIPQHVEKSLDFLGHIFLASKQEDLAIRTMRTGWSKVPETWIKLFGLESVGDSCNCKNAADVFRSPITILAQLRYLEPTTNHAFQNLQFLGKVQTEFRALLKKRDERALWIFGYWLGLMCRYDNLWWCKPRAERDYKAIQMWLGKLQLEKRPGDEGRLWGIAMREFEKAPF